MATTPAVVRLTDARLTKGWTKRRLADEIDVSAQTITLYEQGKPIPPHKLDALAQKLGFPAEYLRAAEMPSIAAAGISFRAQRSMTSRVEGMALARSKHAARLISPWLHERFALPECDLPDLSGESPETAARLLRKMWGLGNGPIENMVHLLEAKGVEVYWLDVDSKSVDAFCYEVEGRRYVFLNTAKAAGERGRFDAAHELAHLVLHSEIPAEAIGSKPIEDEAQAFAAEFLMPGDQFRVESPRRPTLREFIALKPRWKTSVQAMVRRSRDLGLLSDWQYEAAYRDMSLLKWRTTGIEAGQLPREESHLHSVVFENLADEGITPEDLATELLLHPDHLREAMPVAARYMGLQQIRKGHLRLVWSE